MKQFSHIRPKALSQMIGQEKLVRQIRKITKRTIPKSWLFYGATGLGKTSIAKIIAISLQCDHSKFGEPCRACRKSDLPIYDLNASDKTGKDELKEFITGSEFQSLTGKRKVYILDEAHKISDSGQNLLLKYLEDDTNDTVWIICSTEPRKLLRTLRRRCIKFQLQPFDTDHITEYVSNLLEGTELSVEDFVDALVQQGIDSPGIIAQAAEFYVAGASAEDAAKSEEPLDADGLALAIAVTKGDWIACCNLLMDVKNGEARSLRSSIVGLLRKQMLETTEFNTRNKILSRCIQRLCYMQFPDDLTVMAALAAELYIVCEMFSAYKR